jgi:hypothetical protein
MEVRMSAEHRTSPASRMVVGVFTAVSLYWVMPPLVATAARGALGPMGGTGIVAAAHRDATTGTWLAIGAALVVVGAATWWMLWHRDDDEPPPIDDDWGRDRDVG